MRSVKHLTLGYVLARAKESAYQRQHPDLPWLTQDANAFLSGYVQLSDIGLEFGSGRSTLRFASRVDKLVNVEHDKDWYGKVSASLIQKKLMNVDYRYLAGDLNDSKAMEGAIHVITNPFESGRFDFVLVDGVCRDVCAREAIRLIRPGGILVIDNVNRHLPSNSVSPNSRSLAMGPEVGWRGKTSLKFSGHGAAFGLAPA